MSQSNDQPLVGISISDSNELEALGFGQEHLTEMMLAVARTVLRLDDDTTGLVYGGDLRADGFTHRLFDIALSERAAQSADSTAGPKEPPRRIYSYLAWPNYLDLKKSDQARMINACQFLRVTPADAGFAKVPDDRSKADQQDPPAALVASRCLTRMRELSTRGGHPTFEGDPAPPIRARIILGGKTGGYSSFMPGIFEEFLIARETTAEQRHPVPVYVVGAFGGAAGQLAQALLASEQGQPLTLDDQLQKQTDANENTLQTLVAAYAARKDLPQPTERYAALGAAVDAIGQQIRSPDVEKLDNGLTPADNLRLLQSRDTVEILRLLKTGLQTVLRSGPKN